MTTHFVIGAARSGKSRFAACLAAESGHDVVLIATALADDEETAARIARHRADRPSTWQVIEEPYLLHDALAAHARDDAVVIVDCLTMWLANLHYGQDAPADRVAAASDVVAALDAAPGQVVVVSNEVGAGVVPADPQSRVFVDELGRLNQRVAAACDRVTLIAAGLPLTLKDVP